MAAGVIRRDPMAPLQPAPALASREGILHCGGNRNSVYFEPTFGLRPAEVQGSTWKCRRPSLRGSLNPA
jgi:hypothetical protein